MQKISCKNEFHKEINERKEKIMHFRLSSFQKIIVNRKLNATHLIFKLGPSKSWKERGNDNMFLFELKIHHRKC